MASCSTKTNLYRSLNSKYPKEDLAFVAFKFNLNQSTTKDSETCVANFLKEIKSYDCFFNLQICKKIKPNIKFNKFYSFCKNAALGIFDKMSETPPVLVGMTEKNNKIIQIRLLNI